MRSFLILLFFPCFSIAQSPLNANADPSAWKGVNMPVFAQSDKGKNLQQSDFDRAAQTGANVVRLAVRSDPQKKRCLAFFDADGKFVTGEANKGMTELKAAVNMAAKSNLRVIIDMQSAPGYKKGEIWKDQSHWDALTTLWANIARAFKNNTSVAAFDLMSEPNILASVKDKEAEKQMLDGTWSPPQTWNGTTKDYNLQITKIVKAIRAEDNNRWIIVEGFGKEGNPINYNWMKPIQGFDKIIYSFHMFIPVNLTFMGTKYFKAKKLNAEAFVPSRDMEKIDKALAPVIAFQKKYNVPIFVGEFGVTEDAITKKDDKGVAYNGACWMNVVIKKMTDYHWGWTYWDFWSKGYDPTSNTDPRYVVISASMKGTPVTNYCK